MGETPLVAAAAGKVWTELQPGSGRWAEFPDDFIGVPTKEPPPHSEVTQALQKVEAVKKKLPFWVYPGLPIALFGIKVVIWAFGVKAKRKNRDER